MITNSRRVKDLIKNLSGGDSSKAQRLQRHYAMERFLERISMSPYRDNLVLKGGMFVAAMVGLESRSTMDIDATCKGYALTPASARDMVSEIASMDIGDGMTFEVLEVSDIMEDAEYSGVRIAMLSRLDRMKANLKIDLSTGDAITPSEVSFSYKLMLEDRSLSIWTYSLETLFAEKLQTILARSIFNTRPRDFYDIYILLETGHRPDPKMLAKAIGRTCKVRGTPGILDGAESELDAILENESMLNHWKRLQRDFDYAEGITWSDAVGAVRSLVEQLNAQKRED